MPPRSLAKMTPGEREAAVAALSPKWAQDYIRQLEALTRALHAQLTALREDFAGFPGTECVLHPDLPVPGCAACETLSLAEWKDHYARHASREPTPSSFSGMAPAPVPSLPPGITPPQGEYATIRVLDGRAGMEPLADLPEGAEIRFADFYQARYGSTPDTGGAQVLTVETSAPMRIQPVAPYIIEITRA
jgi:hypothetical protein